MVTLVRLAERCGVDATYLQTLIELNHRRLDWVHRALEERVFRVTRHPTIGIWGLTYKKNTRSTRNSPALRVLASLAGRAQVRAWDPAVGSEVLGPEVEVEVEVVRDRDAVLEGVDCLLIMADWAEFVAADLQVIRERSRTPLVIDCAGVLDARRSELAGIEYVAMGQATAARLDSWLEPRHESASSLSGP